MKQFFLKATILCSAFLFISPSFAAIPSGGNNNNSTGLQVIGGYSSQYWSSNSKTAPQGTPAGFFMITPSPSFSDMMLLTYFYNQYKTAITNHSSNVAKELLSTQTAISSLLTATQSKTNTTVRLLTDSLTPKTDGLSAISDKSFNLANDLGSLNVDNLIQPFTYTNSQEASAKSFVNYITNQYAPTPVLNFAPLLATKNSSSYSPLQQALENSNVQQYIYLIRRKAALSSVAISNLNYLYNQRVPQKTSTLLQKLPTIDQTQLKQQLPKNLQTEASPLALQQWMATRRLNSVNNNVGDNSKAPKTWTQSIEQASPATLQRETVYLLAEIQQELFKQRMLQERLLATSSVQQLQSVGSMQIQIQQLQRDICNSKPLNTISGVCPSVPTPPTAATK